MTNEAFARIKIDQLLKDTDWRLTDGISVRYEYPLDDGGRADYALFDRQGRALAVLEAKSTSVSLSAGEAQGRRYADLLDVPFIFLSNGEEIWFCDMGVLGKPKFYIPGFLLSLFEAFDLMSIASGSTVPQLNKQDLHPLNKIVPPLQLQIDFAERADRLESLARHLDAAAAKAEAMAAGLSAEVFG
ncbi:MAG TPA: type I restriction enzyme HsdR N-terminal domain-containing protein [Acidiphilium sp.]|nr:type I restriction enzyme HsdR N-terminal domain-containing protein [Acidiphilium sp.]